MRRGFQLATDNAAPAGKIALVIGVASGVTLGAMTAPQWLPVLVDSITDPEPKAYWHLSRASGLVAYALIWVSVALGLVITSKTARWWMGGYTAVDLHNFTGYLALGFTLFHVVVLLGDGYMDYTVAQLLIPFASGSFRPLWVGLGQIGFYVALLVTVSCFARRRIGQRVWRRLHYASFAAYWLVTAHGILAGTDTSSTEVLVMYSVTGAITYFLFVYRMLLSIGKNRPNKGRAAHERRTSSNPAS